MSQEKCGFLDNGDNRRKKSHFVAFLPLQKQLRSLFLFSEELYFVFLRDRKRQVSCARSSKVSRKLRKRSGHSEKLNNLGHIVALKKNILSSSNRKLLKLFMNHFRARPPFKLAEFFAPGPLKCSLSTCTYF